MREEPWNPTMAQRAAAQRLADNVYDGARVKTRPDGIAEARTIGMGENRHYQISQHGRVTLLGAEPTRRYLLGCVLLAVGTISLLISISLAVVLVEVTDVFTTRELSWAGLVVLPLLAVMFIVGEGLVSPPSPPGEYWVIIGQPLD